ncbi:toxin-antitoxin system YwqK family antitoxin [Allomuricauda sp. F6463D]|uniref:toxin-antitoxin system YwqK family antitoxin n=1 Tax=Allomuricauda sp. F6463D TaxID=2926409 RepID=UPI001FF2426E|nr:nicotinic acid mononucleotide adenyltransferase [Muricauda sp. F6463D]MCK0161032.1 nicotinic acid mononucleotide adenyltransferase [Muricauda sp. F6463D]
MKKAVLVLAVMFTVGISAQDTKPTFERIGKTVKATYFYDNGEVAQTGYMLNGKLHGDWVMFDIEGKKIATGQYLNGEKTGKWFFWENEVLSEVDFTDNRIVHVKKWNQGDAVTVN